MGVKYLFFLIYFFIFIYFIYIFFFLLSGSQNLNGLGTEWCKDQKSLTHWLILLETTVVTIILMVTQKQNKTKTTFPINIHRFIHLCCSKPETNRVLICFLESQL